MEKTLVKLSGIAFLIITGFTAGAYYTMHRVTTDLTYDLPDEITTMPSAEIEENCKKSGVIVIKKKQFLCMPVPPK